MTIIPFLVVSRLILAIISSPNYHFGDFVLPYLYAIVFPRKEVSKMSKTKVPPLVYNVMFKAVFKK